MFHYSKENWLSNIKYDLFTQEEADYAVEQGHFDWKEGSCESSGIFWKRWQLFERKIIRKTC